MRKGWLLLFSLITCLLHATEPEEPLSIRSGEAEYDGQTIILKGDVVAQHGLGQCSAHRLTIFPNEANKKDKFSVFRLADDVRIALKKGGELTCQQAEIDYPNLQAFFWGNPEFELKGKNQDLKINGTEMQAFLSREEKESSPFIQSLKVLGNVNVDFQPRVSDCGGRGSLSTKTQSNLPLKWDHHPVCNGVRAMCHASSKWGCD